MTSETSEGTAPIAAVLLAAGRSQRMGTFKPLLPFGKKTVVESCIDYLREAGIDHIVLVLGHRAEEISRHLTGKRFSAVINPNPDSEMGASIAAGISQLDPSVSATLIALTDQPAIPPAVVRELLARWKSGSRIVKPTFAGRGGHPVLIDLSFRRELMNLDPESGLKGFFRKHDDLIDRLPVDSPFIARDMDTWEDYYSLHKEVFGFAPEVAAEHRPN